MKKIALYVSAAFVGALTLSSCGNGEKADADNDSIVDKLTSDTICTLYGEMAGGYIGSELNNYVDQTGERYNKDKFMEGVAAVVSKEQDEAYAAGINTGLRLLQDIKSMESLGVQVDRKLILNEMRKMLMQDSIDVNPIHSIQDQYSSYMAELQQKADERAALKRAGSPAALDNIKAGEETIAQLKKENPDFKTTPSGLGYVITKAGEGEYIVEGDMVTLDYEGSLLTGSIFDANKDVKMQPGSGLIAGFTEALTKLNKGAEATFYIPGELAYGPNGQPAAGIGPMEMLVFKLTIKDIEKTK